MWKRERGKIRQVVRRWRKIRLSDLSKPADERASTIEQRYYYPLPSFILVHCAGLSRLSFTTSTTPDIMHAMLIEVATCQNHPAGIVCSTQRGKRSYSRFRLSFTAISERHAKSIMNNTNLVANTFRGIWSMSTLEYSSISICSFLTDLDQCCT